MSLSDHSKEELSDSQLVRQSEQMRKLGNVGAITSITGGLVLGFVGAPVAAVATIAGGALVSALTLWKKLSDDRLLQHRRGISDVAKAETAEA